MLKPGFRNCGDGGIYKTFKKKTGVGFAPYLYHGLEYDISKNISLETGLLLPHIYVISLQLNF